MQKLNLPQYHEIIVIDDDDNDRNIFDCAFDALNVSYTITYFSDADSAFNYLKTINRSPFLIVCDINMPGLNGLEFKSLLNTNNNSKLISVPFIIVTTSDSPVYLRYAQSLNIQGYFIKPANVDELKQVLAKVVSYWQLSAKVN